MFEATHGTAPKYADKDVINPGSVMLSGVMLFDFIGWIEAARLIENSMERTIQQKFVTYDFERQMQGATKVGTSEFATRMIENMDAGRALKFASIDPFRRSFVKEKYAEESFDSRRGQRGRHDCALDRGQGIG